MRLIMCVLAVLMLAFPAQSRELPVCVSKEVENAFDGMMGSIRLLELNPFREGKRTTARQRWCVAYYIQNIGNYSFPYMDAIFTVEWINEDTGEFWLQVRRTQRSCRGVSGNPWSRERCLD